MISVIIPIYNVSKYLAKCVNSILAQTYKDIEAILVDDGTPDDCAVICDEYLLNNSNIIAIHKSNGGLSDARNKGLDIANGEYINFLDSDDYVKAEMLEKMQEAIEISKADMCLCGFDCVDEEGNVTPRKNYKDCVMTRMEALEMLVQGNGNFIIACAKLYKKRLFNELRFIKGKIHEDEFMAHRILCRCDKVVSINEVFYMYLQRAASIMHVRNNNIKEFNSVEAYLDRLNFLHEEGYENLSSRVIAQIIPLLLSTKKKFPKDFFEAKNENRRLRKEIVTTINKIDCRNLPIVSKIGILSYKIGDSEYLLWREFYLFLHKFKRKK